MRAHVVVGLGYGDEGKGSTVDYLVRRHGAHTVVRFNGGAQAGHNVVLPDGRHHCFSQWGAGTFAGAMTYFAGDCLINPWHAFPEAEHLRSLGVSDPFRLLHVSRRCLVVTPWHIMLNRWVEQDRGDRRHGSCGQGIGETMRAAEEGYYLSAADLSPSGSWDTLKRVAAVIRDHLAQVAENRHGTGVRKRDGFEEFGRPALTDHAATMRLYGEKLGKRIISHWDPVGDLVFEGAQGVLLDQVHGEAPHRTWSTCTTANADRLLEEYLGQVVRLGVTRTYMTRHGAGPLRTEDPKLAPEPGEHNATHEWQGRFRLGYPDFVQLRKAVKACGNLDGLVLTHCDRGVPENSWCEEYENGYPVMEAAQFVAPEALFERNLGLRAIITSHGPDWTQKMEWAASPPPMAGV